MVSQFIKTEESIEESSLSSDKTKNQNEKDNSK